MCWLDGSGYEYWTNIGMESGPLCTGEQDSPLTSRATWPVLGGKCKWRFDGSRHEPAQQRAQDDTAWEMQRWTARRREKGQRFEREKGFQ